MDALRIFVLKNETCALYPNDSGFYTAIRELIVAETGYGNDWWAARGFVPAEMDFTEACAIVAAHGDKISEENARELASYRGHEDFLMLAYRD